MVDVSPSERYQRALAKLRDFERHHGLRGPRRTTVSTDQLTPALQAEYDALTARRDAAASALRNWLRS